jgi:RHS repeat-associated protein
MKKILLLITTLYAGIACAQTTRVINANEATQNSYSGSSFQYVDKVILKPGFQVSAQVNGEWYAKPFVQCNCPADLNTNFVRTETILTSGITDENKIAYLSRDNKATEYAYVNDLGGPKQTVNVRSTPQYNDAIDFKMFDAFGRQAFEYKPYSIVREQDWGSLRTDPVSEQLNFYSVTPGVAHDARPYGVNTFDDSPANSIKQKYGAGQQWHFDFSNKAQITRISTNVFREVRKWPSVDSGLPVITDQDADYYPPNALQVTESVDEEGHIKRTYKNFRDLIILERTGDGTTWHDTYYVYDFRGSVRFVFPPEASERLASEYIPAADKSSFINQWVFQHNYDAYGRKIESKTPGGSWTYVIYDQWDRIVLTQDGNQRTQSEWTYSKYDIFNRPIISGTVTGSRASLQASIDASQIRFETRSNNDVGYTNNTFPTHNISTIESITFYDDYSFLSYNGWNTPAFNFVNETSFPTSSEVLNTVNEYTTGTRIRKGSGWLRSVTYYDKNYRATQVISENHLGGFDRETYAYSFAGQKIKVKRAHTSAASSLTILEEFTYDHAGRELKMYRTLDSNPRVLVRSKKYNELGELIELNLHSEDDGATFLQSIDLRYNIRGWLTQINNSSRSNDGITNDDNNDLFGMDIIHQSEVIQVGTQTTTPVFNGNISAIRWSWTNQEDAPTTKLYYYNYDSWNRLTNSSLNTSEPGSWVYAGGEQMNYDKNGNISTLNRFGQLGTGVTQIDNLAYAYQGNQLTNIHDQSPYYSKDQRNPAYGFAEIVHNQALTEFEYDANGNVMSDLNKGITAIQYNRFDNPLSIQFEDNKVISFEYDATGTLLRKIAPRAGGGTITIDYVNGLQYINGELAFASTEEGRIIKRGTNFDYEYFLKDHQGNIRVVAALMNETKSWLATLEPERNTKESEDFLNISRSTGFNHTMPTAETPQPIYASSLTGAVGPAKILTVQNNDKVRLRAFARYSGTPGSGNITAAVLASAVTSAFQLTAVGETMTAYNSLQAGVLASPTNGNNNAPRAYLAYFIYSSDYTWSQFGYHAISEAAALGFEPLALDITVQFPVGTTHGYLYAYVANEATTLPVCFDDISITHEKATRTLQVLEASDYYPFGLTVTALSYWRSTLDDPVRRNQYGFQGQERVDDWYDLNWYAYKFRMHDPATGRFGALDPLSEKYYYNSPYAFSENRLVDGIELEGAETLTGFNPYYFNRTLQFGQQVLTNIWDAGKAFGVGTYNYFAILAGAFHALGADNYENVYIYQWGGPPIQWGSYGTTLLNKQTAESIGRPIYHAALAEMGGTTFSMLSYARAPFAASLERMFPTFKPVEVPTFNLAPGVTAAESSALPAAANTSTTGFRYMSLGELQAIQETNLLRGGWPGETYFTKDLYKSATKAQYRLALPNPPTFRVEFKILNNPTLLRNGTKVTPANGMIGGGSEFMTLDKVKVELINWQPLR